MAYKNAILHKKINNIVYDLMIQTTGSLVILNDGSRLDDKIADIITRCEYFISQKVADEKLSKSTISLYKKITGFDSETNLNKTYSTIRELSDWITTEVPTNSQNIVNDIKDLSSVLTALEAVLKNISKSDINGNIKIEDEELSVYTHPDTHSADKIEETEDRKFISPEEKERFSDKDTIVYVDTSKNIDYYNIVNNYKDRIITMEEIKIDISFIDIFDNDIQINYPKYVLGDIGSSKYIEFTLPKRYNLKSIKNIIDGVETNVSYNLIGNKVSFIIKNIGNLSYDKFNIPKFSKNQSIKIVISLA